jgi:hypothetical protein
MKKLLRNSIGLVPLLAICSVLSAFTDPKGGEGFEIYLDKKLVLQQFGSKMNTVKSIQLDPASGQSQLLVKYYHCGQAGKNRTITIKDAQNKILKEWHFANVYKGNVDMSCSVKDILQLNASGVSRIDLYYSSSELPAGRLLTTITSKKASMTKLF